MTEAQKLIKKYGKEEASCVLATGEKNDCVVRAVSHAFEVDYADAHHFCEHKLHRKTGNGVYTGRYMPSITQAFGKKLKQLGRLTYTGKYRILDRNRKSKEWVYDFDTNKTVLKFEMQKVKYKVGEFIKAYSKGNYIVIVRGHAFAVIDGKIFGNFLDDKRLTRQVKSAYKVN